MRAVGVWRGYDERKKQMMREMEVWLGKFEYGWGSGNMAGKVGVWCRK